MEAAAVVKQHLGDLRRQARASQASAKQLRLAMHVLIERIAVANNTSQVVQLSAVLPELGEQLQQATRLWRAYDRAYWQAGVFERDLIEELTPTQSATCAMRDCTLLREAGLAYCASHAQVWCQQCLVHHAVHAEPEVLCAECLRRQVNVLRIRVASKYAAPAHDSGMLV